jgi:hypothetical protein
MHTCHPLTSLNRRLGPLHCTTPWSRALRSSRLPPAGVKRYEFVDAVDGIGNETGVSEREVERWFSGTRLGLWRRRHRHQRGKVAADLSHFLALERIVLEGRPAMLVEDDAGIATSPPFWEGLLAALRELPKVSIGRGARGP